MAGKFLSLEEAARHLGVTVEEVQRHVDRKKLFPMRDGATIKFKADDVDRLAQDLRDEGGAEGELALDLDGPAVGGAASGLDVDELVLGDPVDAGGSSSPVGSPSAANTMVQHGQEAADGGSGLSMPALDGGSAADIVLGGSAVGGDILNDDLALESVLGASSIGASSPSLVAAQSGVTGGPGGGEDALQIDLGDDADVGGSLAVGSDVAKAGSPEATGAGLALSGALDSGLSLEDGAIEMSAIDLGGGGGAAPEDGTVLGGDDFELGGGGGDDDSASVVIAESESGESSFFTDALTGEGSSLGEESVGLPSSIASEAMGIPGEFADKMEFSGLQIAGLVCCSLLLLFGGFIAYDLVRTIGSPESTTLANPLLNALADTFGWR